MRIRLLVAGVAGVAYVLASHWLMTQAPASPWSALAIVCLWSGGRLLLHHR